LGDEPTAVILEKTNVALNAGHIYGEQWGQFARMNFATSPEIITQAITQMARGVRG
jgi:cystathionine beta-lyase